MIIEFLSQIAVKIIETISYPGLFILMALESTIFPIPSEVIMPFAGFLISEGKLNFFLVALISTLGTLTGSLFSYWLGHKFGEKTIKKFGKYILLNEEHLESTKKWFNKHGEKTIFISRFIPVVRHFISIPAGAANMKKSNFIIYTFAGGLIWNSFLTYLGIKLKENWELVHVYSKPLDIILVIIIIILISLFIYKHFKKK